MMENKKIRSKRSIFIDDAYGRVVKGDMSVFEECFTPDFKFTWPEFKLITSSGSLYGKFALEIFSLYIKNDGTRWGSIEGKILNEIESGDQVVRELLYVMKNPIKGFGGFEKLPPDLEIRITAIQLFTFREGKICSCYDTYDTLGFYFDMAQGDLNKVADAIRTINPWFTAQRKAIEKGELPLPDPGQMKNVKFLTED